ncbi:MAG: low molecular weight protein arginine phosphatase [Anaerolineae bacterium]
MVCTGNLCRSPLAAALLRRMLKDAGIEHRVTVVSAGIAALDGQPAAALALEVAAEVGLDLAGHRSRAVDREAMRGADLIVTMEQVQREALAEAFPARAERIHLLSTLAGEEGDVADPYGTGSSSAYQACLQRLEVLLRKALPRILSELDVR